MSRRIRQAIALFVGVSLSSVSAAGQRPGIDLAALTEGRAPRVELYAPPAQAPVELRFFLKPGPGKQSQKVVDTTVAALGFLNEWLGRYPHPTLTVVDAPWRSHLAGAAYPGVVVINSRWLTSAPDPTVERELLGALAREYWTGSAPANLGWLEEGLSLYSGVRAIHQGLSGRNFETHRFFGGFMPFTTRGLLWSPNLAEPRPPVLHFPELEQPPVAPWRAASAARGGEAQRAALAIHTLERYLGWPALQQVLSSVRERTADGSLSVKVLNDVITEQRGRDLSWFFAEALRFDASFDYAVTSIASVAAPDDPSKFMTTVELRRLGDAIFAGTNEARVAAFETARSLPVTVRFEDGTVVSDWWDGRDTERELKYESRSRAVSASVDPDAVLLLDINRANNTLNLRPGIAPVGIRLALNWLIWLQDLMLMSTAVA